MGTLIKERTETKKIAEASALVCLILATALAKVIPGKNA